MFTTAGTLTSTFMGASPFVTTHVVRLKLFRLKAEGVRKALFFLPVTNLHKKFYTTEETYRYPVSRPLKNAQFWSRSRKARILATGIY